jgi:hypothetical protein
LRHKFILVSLRSRAKPNCAKRRAA